MIYFITILIIGMLYYASIINDSIPDSISSIAYIIPKWIFSTWIVILGISLMFPLMNILTYQWIGFIMIVGLFCVAASPYYKTKDIKLHYVGAIICFIFALLTIWFTNPYMLLLWCIYPVALLGKMRKHWLMTAEIICLIELLISI